MRAAILHGPEKLSIENIPVPDVPEGWARVQVAYNSICGSDVAFYGNVWHGTSYPAVPGHEWSGTVVASRSGLVGEGERVVGDLAMTCGHCLWCRRSQRAMCRELREFGFTDPGGCADFVVVPAGNLFRLPEHIDLLAATQVEPLAVALHALARVRLAPGETVAVLGCGGIGLTLLQAAKAAGGIVMLAVDPITERARTAEILGALVGITDPNETTQWISDHDQACLPDVVLEASGEPDAIRLATELVRPGGRIGCVGYRVGQTVTLPSAVAPLKLLELIGVMGPGRHFEPAVQLLASGVLRTEEVITTVVDLEQTEHAFHAARRRDPGVIRIALKVQG